MLMVVVVGADEDGDHDQQHTAPADRAAPPIMPDVTIMIIITKLLDF